LSRIGPTTDIVIGEEEEENVTSDEGYTSETFELKADEPKSWFVKN